MIPLSHFDKRLGDALIPFMSARFLATTRMRWSGEMCDYSLHNVKTRPAKVGDKLITRQFHSGTTGFSAPEDASMAVCVLPGTELSFRDEVRRVRLWLWTKNTINHKTEAELIRQAGAFADRLVLETSPAVQACRRVRLPAQYLYHTTAAPARTGPTR